MAILSSSILALLLSLPVALWLGIKVDVVALSEAIPFLVCTVGFDKPMRLARQVFSNPWILRPVPDNQSPVVTPRYAPFAGHLPPSGEIVLASLQDVYIPIIRDYALEIAVLLVGANLPIRPTPGEALPEGGGISAVREVCSLAAVILTIDCLLMCTWLSSIFGVMVEVTCFLSSRL